MNHTANAALEEPFLESDQVRWKRLFPWLHLSDVVRLSLDPRKWLLAVVGAFVFAGCHAGLNWLPFHNAEGLATETSGAFPPIMFGDLTAASAVGASSEAAEPGPLWSAAGSGQLLDRIWNDPIVVGPVVALMSAGSIVAFTDALTQLILGVVVWAFFGGAIARITSLQFAGDHPSGLIPACRYAAANLPAAVFSLLLPITGIIGMWLLAYVGGWVGRIPVAGPIVAGLFWFLVLMLAVGVLLIAVGVCLSWPLMICGIAAEGTDAFDALSRAFSYLFSRPIYVAWLFIVTLALGSIAALVIGVCATAIVSLGEMMFFSSGADPASFEGFALVMRGFWEAGVSAVSATYPIAYFWTASTVVYFLLRLSVDAMPLDRVHLPDDPQADDLVPLVGVPAAERREAARAADADTKTSDDATDQGEQSEAPATTDPA